jgi:hypothetical protein
MEWAWWCNDDDDDDKNNNKTEYVNRSYFRLTFREFLVQISGGSPAILIEGFCSLLHLHWVNVCIVPSDGPLKSVSAHHLQSSSYLVWHNITSTV